jgi:large subunit ribosomal protein L33
VILLGDILMRERIVLACNECKNRNYNKYKNKKNTLKRIELKKYCKFCKTHTLHKEIK